MFKLKVTKYLLALTLICAVCKVGIDRGWESSLEQYLFQGLHGKETDADTFEREDEDGKENSSSSSSCESKMARRREHIRRVCERWRLKEENPQEERLPDPSNVQVIERKQKQKKAKPEALRAM